MATPAKPVRLMLASSNGKTQPEANIDWGGKTHDLSHAQPILGTAGKATSQEILNARLALGHKQMFQRLIAKYLGYDATALTPMERADKAALLLSERLVLGLTCMTTPGALPATVESPWVQLVQQALVQAFEEGKKQAALADRMINEAIEEVHIQRSERMMASIIKVAMDTFGIERMELLASDITGAWDDKRQLHISQDEGGKTFIYQLDPKPAVPYSSALAAEVTRNGQQALADIQAALSLDLSEPQSGSILFNDDGHVLFSDNDKDRPDSICDRNGQVVLGLCKVCNRGEAELAGPCPGAPKPQGFSMTSVAKTLDDAEDLGVL